MHTGPRTPALRMAAWGAAMQAMRVRGEWARACSLRVVIKKATRPCCLPCQGISPLVAAGALASNCQ